MIKEFVTIKSKETAIKIQSSKIDAIRVKDITKKGVRVYDNGLIETVYTAECYECGEDCAGDNVSYLCKEHLTECDHCCDRVVLVSEPHPHGQIHARLFR
jgi:hypothetical protein